MVKRVRTLLRVSSKQQLHDDDIPIQRAEAEQYIAKRSDWVFDKEYLEKAVSAYKNSAADREILQEILEDARNHEFEVLLAYMSDRIGRQEEYSFYVATLNQLGIEVWTIKDGQLKTEDHIDKLLNYIRFWQNEGESKKTSMRVRDTQKEMVKSGKFVGGRAPYGYRLVPSGEISNHGRLLKKLEIVEDHAEVVRRIYSYAVNQGYGYKKIADILNEEGIAPIEVDKWKGGTICSILKNPVYMGYYAINRRINHGSFTKLDRRDWIYSEKQIPEIVIIEPEIWEKAQEIREARKSKIQSAKNKALAEYEQQHGVPFSTKGKLALVDFVYCGYCGKKLMNGSYSNSWTTKAGEKKIAFAGKYYCPERCKERAHYSQEYLEGIVFKVVADYMSKLKNIDVTEELEKTHEQKCKSINTEIAQIKKEQKKLLLDIETLEEKIPEAIRGDYYFSIEKLSEMVKDKQAKVEELKRLEKEKKKQLKIMDIEKTDLQQFVKVVPNWSKEFMDADTATKKMLLASVIDKIIVKKDDITIKFKISLDNFKTDTNTEKTEVALENMETSGDNLLLEKVHQPTIPYIHDSV